ncbi:XRE family transcriptional regulator [Salmonella enterica]|uniref:XRE family transcriptional regulator n=2 Tax=Salmonella enterica subsp. salamae TaxID=59202 RepID=A0A701VUK4_SALER|nr:XRE family transcriptional regulator [Salmonella enterica]ECA7919357.1 XRE family transcriptional regulator [Salmonella enterica subsp. enterica serovar Chichester]ECE5983727.1 XRE family transcriptional regulator [Salmonella enterica subsp. salamae]EDR0943265.1 helix-turn-helix transcriptional regulator [Salmonella enterica subsp. arizonae]EKR2155640.1 helix-turn-helix transcriptional regulator [Salmonella enterica subsp. salamae serovar 40:c:z6]HAC6411070.1 XRE family transcriptional regu
MEKTGSIKKMLGNRIRELRRETGLSQEDFADKCGIDRSYMSGIERGVRNPTLEILWAISGGLGLDLSQLFMFETNSKEEKEPMPCDS